MSYKKRFLNVWLLIVFLGFINVSAALSQPLPGGTLDPTTIPKFVTPLVIPPEMPSTSTLPDGTQYYEIAVRQFTQQILPAGFPVTTVWSYGSANHPGTFHYPAFTIEAPVDVQTRVKWINELIDKHGNFLPHLLPVDQTLHWANPPGGLLAGMGMGRIGTLTKALSPSSPTCTAPM